MIADDSSSSEEYKALDELEPEAETTQVNEEELPHQLKEMMKEEESEDADEGFDDYYEKE